MFDRTKVLFAHHRQEKTVTEALPRARLDLGHSHQTGRRMAGTAGHLGSQQACLSSSPQSGSRPTGSGQTPHCLLQSPASSSVLPLHKHPETPPSCFSANRGEAAKSFFQKPHQPLFCPCRIKPSAERRKTPPLTQVTSLGPSPSSV